MAKINLLPWRQERREERKVEFFIMLGISALSAAALMGVLWILLNSQLTDQQSANQTIKDATDSLTKDLSSLDGLDEKRAAIVDRIKLIQDLQGKRPIVVHIFDEIVRRIPSNMYLTKIKRAGDTLEISGKAESPNVVSEFMRSLDSSDWFQNSFMTSYTTPVEGGNTGPTVANLASGIAAPSTTNNTATSAQVSAAESPVAGAGPTQFVAPTTGHPEDGYGQFIITVKLQHKNNWVDEAGDQLKETTKKVEGDAVNPLATAQASSLGEVK